MDLKYVVQSAMNGNLRVLMSMTKEDKRTFLAAPLTTSDGSETVTPLIAAIKYGRHETSVWLINAFREIFHDTPEAIDAPGKVVSGGGIVVDGATALWVAAEKGFLNEVSLLIEVGRANIDQQTVNGSTPLRAASFHGYLAVVKYLLEQGADPNLANKFNNTCLMIAAYNGHVQVVKELLSRKSDPNVKANCGSTALDYAIDDGTVETVRQLALHGADLKVPSSSGLSLVMMAAERAKIDVFHFLMEFKQDDIELDPLERIDALELLGASLGNDREHEDLHRAYAYLLKAWEERLELLEIRTKPESSQRIIDAYGPNCECQTLEQLRSIRNDHYQLQMECLKIRERLLGPGNPDLPPHVLYRGAVFADNGDFSSCLRLWRHVLRLREGNPVPSAEILRFIRVFWQMLRVKKTIEFEDFFHVFEISAAKLKSVEKEGDEEEKRTSIIYFLCFLFIYLKFKPGLKEEENARVMKVLFEVIKADYRLSDGSALLHLTVNQEVRMDDVDQIMRLPNADLTELLLSAGANPTALDGARNTPLHLIVAYKRFINDFATIYKIITQLVSAKIHVDVVNANGKTPLQIAIQSSSVAEIIIKTQTRLSLKCLSAQAVKKFGLEYANEELIPTDLIEFIDLH